MRINHKTLGRAIRGLAALIALLILGSQCPDVLAQGTAFTYQGKLNQNSSPVSGLFDVQFAIYDAATNGNAVAPPVTNTATPVTNGLFTVTLDFGPGVFTGPARWLQISVRTNGSTGSYSLLQPRQEVMPAPYAMFAPVAGTAQTVPPGSVTAADLASNAVGEAALSSNLLAKVNAFLVWQGQTLPVITSSNSVLAPAGYPFEFDVTVTNFPPFAFNATGVPNGLSFVPLDTLAQIIGTCNSTGSFPVAISVGNVAGTIGTNVLMTFVPSAPSLDLVDLQNYYARYLHGGVEFDAIAYGFPLYYEWLQNGALLAGETTNSLILSNLTFSTTGGYTIVASNTLGLATGAIQLYVNNLAAWGYFCDGGFAEDTAPGTLTNVIATANNCAILALTADSRIFLWDDNGTNYVPPLSNVVAVAEGAAHSMALRTNGTVVAWGDNSLGQTNVPPGATNVVAVAANVNLCVALKANGTVIYWGDDPNGESTPPANATNVFAFAKGDSHSVALRGDSTVVAWGDDTYGQIDVPAGLTNVVAIAAGLGHTLALLNNGTVTGWGDTNALAIPAGLTNVVGVAAGDTVSVAILADGTWTWWGDPDIWSDTDFPSDLSHVAAVSVTDDDFSAVINDTKNFILSGKVNTNFGYQIQPSGRSNYIALGLPPGLGINKGTGVVSGTPSKAGNWSTMLGTRNAVTNATQVFYIQISP